MAGLLSVEEKLDPDWDAVTRVMEMLAAGLAAGVLWVFFRLPNAGLMLIIGAAFIAMSIHTEPRWHGKFFTALKMAVGSGVMQFFIAMLAQEKYLLLFWIFTFCILLLRYWPNRAASTVTIAIGSLGIAAPAGFQPGMDRLIFMVPAGCCALLGAALTEYLFTPWRLRMIMSRYLVAIGRYLAAGTSPDTADAELIRLKLDIFRHARKANQLLAGQRFLFRRHINLAMRTQNLLERVHLLLRATLLFNLAQPDERHRRSKEAATLPPLLNEAARQIRRGDRLDLTRAQAGSSDDMAGRALQIAAEELNRMNGAQI